MFYIHIYFGDTISRYYLEYVIKWIDLVKKYDVGWNMISSFNGIWYIGYISTQVKKVDLPHSMLR